MAIADQVAAVRAEIAAACERVQRDPTGVHLIAVTKSQGPEVLPPLLACGIRDFGENRSDHLVSMAQAAPEGAVFHHIGRIQSRQIDRIVGPAQAVHGLCEVSHARILNQCAAAAGRRITVFCQVNTSGEDTKAGVEPEALPGVVAELRSCANLDLVGLMTMAPELGTHADAGTVRACFRRLRELAAGLGLPRLSMGMSGDFTLAVEEGATDIRIGSRLFA